MTRTDLQNKHTLCLSLALRNAAPDTVCELWKTFRGFLCVIASTLWVYVRVGKWCEGYLQVLFIGRDELSSFPGVCSSGDSTAS